MSNTHTTPTTAAQQAEVDFGKELAAGLIDSTILSFGANELGEIYLSTIKDGKITELIVGKDEEGEITLYEVENGQGGEL